MNLHVLCFHCNREAKHKLEDQRLMLCFSSLHVPLNFSFTYPTVLMFISYTLSTVPFDHLSQPLDYPHLVTSAPHSHQSSLIWFHISPLSYPSYCCILLYLSSSLSVLMQSLNTKHQRTLFASIDAACPAEFVVSFYFCSRCNK